MTRAEVWAHYVDDTRLISRESGAKVPEKNLEEKYPLLNEIFYKCQCVHPGTITQSRLNSAAKLKLKYFWLRWIFGVKMGIMARWENLFLCHPFSQLKHPRFSLTKTDSGSFHPQTPWTLITVCCIQTPGPWRNSSPSAPHCMLMYEYLRGPAQHYATLEHN